MSRMFAVSLGCIGLFVACSSNDASDEATAGQVSLAIATTPSDVQCLVIQATGSGRTVTRPISVTPGQVISTSVTGLPTGSVSIGANAYSVACSAVTASSIPNWQSDPITQTITLTKGNTVNLNLVLRPAAAITANVDWQDDAAGGSSSTGGATSTGGAATGGSSTGGGVNCSAPPLTGGTLYTVGTKGTLPSGYSYEFWMNGSGASMNVYNVNAAFKATWSAATGDMLARMGLVFDQTKTYDQLGTITSDFAYTKTGTGGGYSYIGIYGWSTTPCVEYYIVDDSFSTMPVNPSGTSKGTATIDGATYNLYTRTATGTGGNLCGSGVTSWSQFYSVRQTARQCGTISVTEHFNAWKNAGMALGKMVETRVLVETGGGSGNVDYTTATVVVK